MKNLIYSIINGKRYDSVLDFKTIKSIIETVNEYQCIDESYEIIEMYSNKTYDPIQKRTLIRITKNKLLKPYNYIETNHKFNNNIIEDLNIITKQCPHCNHNCFSDINTMYIICGYTNSHTGYDWKGCGKDWCFKCGKILCKSWDINQLFLEMNRIHDTNCCKNHSKENNKQYPEDYCQCINR